MSLCLFLRSHAITASRPLTYRPWTNIPDIEAYRGNGTPADCVALGIHHWKDVDLVLSGINIGTNLGNGLWHSGTLAAAKQATLFGVRGIALSTPSTAPGGTEPDFSALEPHAARVLERVIDDDSARLLNVNLPPSRCLSFVTSTTISMPKLPDCWASREAWSLLPCTGLDVG